MVEIGSILEELRLRQKLTLRQVEERSLLFAQEHQDSALRISASWLSRLERGTRHALSLSKLILLAHIYGVTPDDLLEKTFPREPTSVLHDLSSPNVTMLLHEGPLDEQAQSLLRSVPAMDKLPEKTRLLPRDEKSPGDTRYLRGVIGSSDALLSPWVPPGSVVVVDTRQRALLSGKDWASNLQRPIYFLLTHESYVCGWCDLDQASDWLTVVAHPLSGASSQRWRFRRDIECLGRVVLITVPWGRN